MTIIDADKFLEYLIFSKHIDGLTCGEVKEAIKMCKVDEVITKKGVMTRAEAQRYYEGVLDGFRESEKCFREENKALEQEPCDDAISRQAVLDMWKKESCGNRCRDRHRCSETYCDFKLFQNKLGHLPSVNPQEPKTDTWSIKDVGDALAEHGLIADQEPNWIPCSERLPEEEYKNYLVSTSDDEVDIGSYGSEKGWSMCDADGFYYPRHKGIEVVAWMPLPKSYEPQERSDKE